jgi:hypothetical protein
VDIVEFKKDLRELLEKYNVELEVVLDGDTYGIDADFEVYDKSNGKAYTLNKYSTTLDAFTIE